uniref:Uncharacterized protein n=1 Tax=viral metagenome TaxID=1070528 RepID=A0A6M3J8B7_9ZZZZ
MARNFQWQKAGNGNGRLGYLISFEYDEATIKALKERVPFTDREWRPSEKTWWVYEKYEKVINDLFPGFLEAVAAQRPLFTDEQLAEAEKSKELWL